MRLSARLIAGAVELFVGALCLFDILWWHTYILTAVALCFFAVTYLLYRREAVLNHRSSASIRHEMTIADVKQIELKYAALPDFDTFDKRALMRPPLERYFYFARYEQVRRLIDSYVGDEARALDMGCGFGKTTYYMGKQLKRSVVGLDLTYLKLMAARADATNNCEDCTIGFVCGDANEPPFRRSSFDCIVLSEVLEHFIDPAAGLRACADLLCDGGTLIITAPSRHNLSYTNNPFVVLEKLLSLGSNAVLPPYHNLHARFEYNWRKPEPEYGMHYNFSRQQTQKLLQDAGLQALWSGSFEVEIFPYLLIELIAGGDLEFIRRYVAPMETIMTRLPIIRHLGQHLLWVARKGPRLSGDGS